MILIAASEKDPAGVNIASCLREDFDFEKTGRGSYAYEGADAELVITPNRIINEDYFENRYPGTEAILFITRHVSKEGVSSITAHTPGNFNDAQYGGREKTLCISNPAAQKLAICTMEREREKNDLDFQVTLEATHHGPLTAVPTTFLEIGSSEKQWKNEDAGHAVASAAIAALDYGTITCKKAIGVGGGHYPEKLTRLMIETDWAVGHIIPRYAFPLDEDIIRQAVEKNNGGTTAIFDWKGTPARSQYKSLFESFGLEILKTKDF